MDGGEWPKFLVVSRCWPPVAGGMPMVMYKLFCHIPKHTCIVLRGDASDADGTGVDPQLKLAHPDVYCDVPKWVFRLPGGRAYTSVLRWLWLNRVVRQGCQLVRQHKCSVVLGMYPYRSSVLAAWRIALRTGKPLLYYLHDIVEQTGFFGNLEAFVVNRSLRKALNSARRVFVITEGLQEHYAGFLKQSPDLLLQTVTLSEQALNRDVSHASCVNNPPWILYTGSITQFQRDSVQRVARWAHRQPKGAVRFTVCTFTPTEELSAQGILGRNVEATRVSPNEVFTLQQKADILLVPVTFEVYNDEVKTLYPSKIIEYMNAGIPILVCAPKNTFIHHHVAKYQYAALVDKPDEAELDSTLHRLFTDTLYRRELVKRAYECVSRHAWEQVIPLFKRGLQEAAGENDSRKKEVLTE